MFTKYRALKAAGRAYVVNDGGSAKLTRVYYNADDGTQAPPREDVLDASHILAAHKEAVDRVKDIEALAKDMADALEMTISELKVKAQEVEHL